MSQDSIVRTLASVQFPGVYLQMDGHGVTFTESGSGNLGVGHGAGPLDQFKIRPQPTEGPWVTALESAAYAGVCIRMDGNGVTQTHPQGGKVNKQLGQFGYEMFVIRPQADGTVAIESQAFPGVYLSLSMRGASGEPGVVINCQFGAEPLTKFRLETPPAKTRLRVLTYNTHLMQFSFLETATDLARELNVSPYAVFEDEARRNLIIRNVTNSLADIVCLQEVWGMPFIDHFKSSLQHLYPYSLQGDILRIVIFFEVEVDATSGLLLLSKFDLTHRFFQRFPDMEGLDDWSNKGVLGGVAHIPTAGQLRIGTGHTTGAVSDIQVIAHETVTIADVFRDMPSLIMGDFNIGWKRGEGNEDYQKMKTIFSFPGVGIKAANDSWIDVHGEGLTPNPYTVKMCNNTLHQLFSPERDTEPDTRLDYLWVKPGVAEAWKPVTASVPQGPDWVYTSHHWHWGHKDTVARMPAAAVLGDRLVVVSKNRDRIGRDRDKLGVSAELMTAVFNQQTSKWVHYKASFNTTAPPGIVAIKTRFHLFYRDGGGNGILHRSSSTGAVWSNLAYVGSDTGGSVCPIVFKGKLHLLFVDPGEGPEDLGGQIFCCVKLNDDDNWGPGNWTPRTGIGITTLSDISATVFNDKLYVFSKNNGDGSVMWSRLDVPGGTEWHPDRCFTLSTSGSPGVITIKDRLHLYYRHNEGNAIFHASYDGTEWKEVDQNTNYDQMIGGVCPILFKDKLLLFYPHMDLGYYNDRIMIHTQLPDIQVDLSDHYPLLVELEARTILINVVVDISGIGKMSFEDGEWAGTRGDQRQLEQFRLTSRVPNLKLSYMAHIQDEGDTVWKHDGEFVGTSGKRVEGFRIRLEGEAASLYELSYRAHLANYGDTDYYTAGEYCGTTLEKRAVEAMWIRLEKKVA